MATLELIDFELFDLQWIESDDHQTWQSEEAAAEHEYPSEQEGSDYTRSLSPARLAQHELLGAESEKQLARHLQQCFDLILTKSCCDENSLQMLLDGLLDQRGIDEGQLDTILTLVDLLLLQYHLAHLAEAKPIPAVESSLSNVQNCLAEIPWDRDFLLHLAVEHSSANPKLHQLVRRIHHIRNRLVSTNIRLVYHIALQYRDKGMELDDLIQEGVVGLMRAAFKFDIHAESRFSTYAFWWINQAIKQAIAKQHSLIRYPSQIDQKVRVYHAFKQRYKYRYGNQPDEQAIEEETGLSRAQQRALLALSNRCISANHPMFDDGFKTLQDDLVAEIPLGDPLQEIEQRDQVYRIAQLLMPLSERERKALCMKYGIGQPRSYSLREIAPQLGVSKERTRQIIQEALDKIRHRESSDSSLPDRVPASAGLP